MTTDLIEDATPASVGVVFHFFFHALNFASATDASQVGVYPNGLNGSGLN